ncbi:hypothetical protein Ae505Ps2_4398c [Pseudonocardia sp. Ae505_Ps2]|nr:hypothetical protein Ae505Ps2_4398c [Pseudonocardia sp. Ae505_Ps2]
MSHPCRRPRRAGVVDAMPTTDIRTALTDDDRAFLARPLHGFLSVAGGPVPPQPRPVWFEATDDGTVQLFTGPESLHIRRRRKDPRASLVVAAPVGERERWIAVEGGHDRRDRRGARAGAASGAALLGPRRPHAGRGPRGNPRRGPGAAGDPPRTGTAADVLTRRPGQGVRRPDHSGSTAAQSSAQARANVRPFQAKASRPTTSTPPAHPAAVRNPAATATVTASAGVDGGGASLPSVPTQADTRSPTS